jgi:hypothetical protein
LDADSEGEEGKFYLWTLDEIQQILVNQQDIDFLVAAYDITNRGNFEGKTVLQRAKDAPLLAKMFSLEQFEIEPRLSALHGKLMKARELRVRPGVDDKALTSWNALMMLSFSEAARYLDCDDYKIMAMRNGTFLVRDLLANGNLLRSWRAGKSTHQAYLEDYASVIIALVSLYQTDPDPTWFTTAFNLTKEMIAHFYDPEGGFFDTRDDHERLIYRPKDIQDNAVPSGNSLAVTALLYISALQGIGEWRDYAETVLRQVQDIVKQYPLAFSYWLCAIDIAISPQIEVAIIGHPDLGETKSLQQAVWSRYRPNLVVASASFPPPEGAPKLVENRPLYKDIPTAYVCRSFVCHQPVNTPAELLAQLDNLDDD